MSSAHVTRASLPDALRDTSRWPSLDLEAMEPRHKDKARARHKALGAYLAGHKVAFIRSETGICGSEILRLLNRCIQPHDDGGIFGWRGLVPWRHVKPYERTAARGSGAGGCGGAFTQFLRAHPEIAGPLDEVILTTRRRDALGESRFSHRETYGRFKRLCIAARISSLQYPLSNADGGRRALRRYARELLNAHFTQRAARLGGSDARLMAKLSLGTALRKQRPVPFDLVSLDAHRLNFIGCLGVQEGSRIVAIPMQRLQILPVIDIGSTCVLGYHVCIGGEPTAQDVVRAVQAALTPWKPRSLSLPGQAYPPGAVMPSLGIPESSGLCWNAMLLDNASVHCARAVSENLRQQLGCAINFGPVRQWYRRPLVESLFSALERAGFTRLPNSVGYRPGDPLRGGGAKSAIKYQMMLGQMLDLIDIVVCTYNATPREGLDHLSPLQVLADAMLCAPVSWLPRSLPELPARLLKLGIENRTVTVRGDASKGRRPYIQYMGVHYASPVLSGAYDLIGERLRIQVSQDDLSSIRAFLANGEEIGILTAASGWARTPHDQKLRIEILHAMKDGALAVAPDEDPIQKFLVLKHRELVQDRLDNPKRRDRVSREATALARALRAAQQPQLVSAAPARSPAPQLAPRAARDPLPSFVPTLKHRGVQS